jgi:integrase
MASKKRIGNYRPITTGVPGRFELRVSGGPDPARPGKYLQHRKPIGPLNKKGKPLTQRDIELELASFVAEAQTGRLPKTGMTFGELLDKYLAALDVQGRENSTLRTYRGYIRAWLREPLGNVPLAQLTSRHFDAVYAAMREAGRSPSTINQVHAICRKACNLAITWGFLDVNPTRGTIRPTVRKPRRIPAEVGALLRTVRAATTEDPAIGVFILFAAGTGARRGEVCGVQLPDLDWDGDRVHIQRAVGRDDDGSRIDGAGYEPGYGEVDVEVKLPKDFQDRWVDVPAPVMHALKIHVERMAERAGWARVQLASDAYLFSPDADGRTPWKPDFASAAFARARTKAGTEGLKLKDTRHLLGSTMANSGVPIPVIQEVLGHDSSTTTLDFYVDGTPGAGRLAAEALDHALSFDEWLTAAGIQLPDSDAPESGVA